MNGGQFFIPFYSVVLMMDSQLGKLNVIYRFSAFQESPTSAIGLNPSENEVGDYSNILSLYCVTAQCLGCVSFPSRVGCKLSVDHFSRNKTPTNAFKV